MTTCMGNGCSPAVAGNVLMVPYFVLSLFPRDVLVSWVRFGIELSQFLRIFLPTFSELFTGDTSKDNHPLGPVIRGVSP